MCNKNDGSTILDQEFDDAFEEHMTTDMDIQGRQRVILIHTEK